MNKYISKQTETARPNLPFQWTGKRLDFENGYYIEVGSIAKGGGGTLPHLYFFAPGRKTLSMEEFFAVCEHVDPLHELYTD